MAINRIDFKFIDSDGILTYIDHCVSEWPMGNTIDPALVLHL